MNFKDKKAEKISNSRQLRISNAIGMVHWHETEYEYADTKLRLLHPASVILIIAMVIVAVIMQGVPDTYDDMKSTIKNDTVWW